MTAPTMKPKLPAGLRWSDVWRDGTGTLVEGAREVPVDADKKIAARLRLCSTDECPVEQWDPFEFGPDGALLPAPVRFCPEHGSQLVAVAADGSDADPVGTARQRLTARVQKVLTERRDRALQAAQARLAELRAAAVAEASAKALDMAKHRPSLAVSGVALAGGLTAAAMAPVWAVAGGGVAATVGAGAAYAGAYWWKTRGAGEVVGRAARRARTVAHRAAAGAAAAGLFTAQAGVLGVDASTATGACILAYEMLSGCALTWAVNRRHWEKLWADRRRLRELARKAAEAAAEQAQAEVARLESLPQAPTPAAADETPEAVGLRMAVEWQRIARSSTVPVGFPMAKTWIVPCETRSVTVPVDGELVHIGWEFTVEAEPGALVARNGMTAPPLLQAREWLAAMLERDPSTVSLVDRPEGRANRGLLLLTDKAPLGGAVRSKGPAGVRRAGDGTIYVHIGRTIVGDDVDEAVYTPGQPFGGLTVGHTGGGKSAGNILSILNDLWAGILPVLYDPKQLVDYADFVGVFPIGVTREHRDVILQSLHAERRRRERHLASRPMKDRHGRVRTQQSLWSPAEDGPPIHHYWDEFHMEAKEQQFVASLTELFRLQRVSAMGGDIATQGGGLADFADSVLRGLLNQQRMRLYRMPDNLARLAGYTGTYMPSQLPRLPGMCLTVTAEVPELPLRFAFVTRDDVDGCVYDQLYAPDGSQILFAPKLPPETVEVFEREGLMDLWRLGQGPNGMSNLLSSSPGSLTTPGAVVAAGGKLSAADILLGIVSTSPGCARAWIDAHPMWLTAAGGGKPPVPSTVSRAAGQLEKTGLLSRGEGGADYRVTPAGAARAASAWAQLSATSRPAQMSAAEVERAAEVAAELDETPAA